jgi:hypothetical protein
VEGLIMRKLIDFLAPVGLAVMAGGAIAARQGYALKPDLNVYLYVGLALVLLHVALRWEDIYRGTAATRPCSSRWYSPSWWA